MTDQYNEWMPKPSQPTSLEMMDQLISKLAQARQSYEKAKKISADEYHKLEEVELEVMNTLKSAGKSKYEAEGVALIYISSKEVYATPKTTQQKDQLFGYIREKYGQEACTTMLSINHQTLNSWCNKEVEADPTLQIPGLDSPTSVETLNFRKK